MNKNHISINVKSGAADSNDAYSKSKKSNPPNFSDYHTENFLNNAEYTIRYFGKTFYVYINGAEQLRYYYPNPIG